MADSLSRSEVESLLSALDPKHLEIPSETALARHESSANGKTARSSSSLARSAVLFCESVRKRMEVVWEPLLRESVRLKRHMPRSLPFTELLKQQESSSLGFLVESKQDRADLMLFIESSLVDPLVTRMLGNSGSISESHELTELEIRILNRSLRECFREPLPFCRWSMAALDRLEFAAERSTRSGSTSWWTESWELKADSMRGKIVLAGEWEFVSNSYGNSATELAETEHCMTEEISEVVVEIDSIPLDHETIRNMRPGDTFPAGENIEQMVKVLRDGQTSWVGRPVEHEGRNAVEIASPAKNGE